MGRKINWNRTRCAKWAQFFNRLGQLILLEIQKRWLRTLLVHNNKHSKLWANMVQKINKLKFRTTIIQNFIRAQSLVLGCHSVWTQDYRSQIKALTSTQAKSMKNIMSWIAFIKMVPDRSTQSTTYRTSLSQARFIFKDKKLLAKACTMPPFQKILRKTLILTSMNGKGNSLRETLYRDWLNIILRKHHKQSQVRVQH